jgi:hypothetical protein
VLGVAIVGVSEGISVGGERLGIGVEDGATVVFSFEVFNFCFLGCGGISMQSKYRCVAVFICFSPVCFGPCVC